MIDKNRIDVEVSGAEELYDKWELPQCENLPEIIDIFSKCDIKSFIGELENGYYTPFYYEKNRKGNIIAIHTAFLYGNEDNYYYVGLSRRYENIETELLLKIDCSYFSYEESLKYILSNPKDFFND